MDGSCVADGGKKKLCRDSVVEREWKGPLGRIECRSVMRSVCRMDFKDVDRIQLAYDGHQ